MKYVFDVKRSVELDIQSLRHMVQLPDGLTWADITPEEVSTMLEDVYKEHCEWLDSLKPVMIYTRDGAKQAVSGTHIGYTQCVEWLGHADHFIVDERNTMNTPERVVPGQPYTLRPGVDVDVYTPEEWQEVTNHG